VLDAADLNLDASLVILDVLYIVIRSCVSRPWVYIMIRETAVCKVMYSARLPSLTIYEASSTPTSQQLVDFDDMTIDNQEQNDEDVSATSTDYIPYTATELSYATTSSAKKIANPTLISFALPDAPPKDPTEVVQPVAPIIIVSVVVGVVVILAGIGLMLRARRRKMNDGSSEDVVDDESVYRKSCDSGDSFVLQMANRQSVEMKRGVLISVPSRGRVQVVSDPAVHSERQ
jgi:hypothetical protein